LIKVFLMWTIIFLIIIYFFWLQTFIETASIGKSLFFPNFVEIADAYYLSKYNWNSWHGKMFYYIGLLFNLIIALIIKFIFFIIKLCVIIYIFDLVK